MTPHLAAALGQDLWPGPIRRFEQVDSTMRLAQTWALAGAPEGSTVVATSQTAGRGRHGRAWVSPPGAGLWMTLILRPENPEPGLALVAGLAAWQTAVAHGVPAARLKWPNDLLVGDRKLGGVLLQSGGDTPTCAYVLVGVGINVAVAANVAASLPPELLPRYVGLNEVTSQPTTTDKLLETLRAALHLVYRQWQDQGLAPICAAWGAAHAWPGAWVQAQSQNATVEGEICGLGEAGQLRLRTARGCIVDITTGEVIRIQRKSP